MRKCRVCLHEISDASRICEHCGEDLIHGRRPTAPSTLAIATVSRPATTKTCPFCAEEIQAAAIVCKHCGRDLTGGVPTRPVVVASAPRRAHGWLWLGLIVLGLGIVLVVLTVVDSVNSPSERHLNASVHRSAFTVTVTNDDHQDWNNVRVRVNDKYFCPGIAIAEGQTGTVPLAGCTSLDGVRFRPAAMAAVGIVVTAVLVNDTSEAVAGFKVE